MSQIFGINGGRGGWYTPFKQGAGPVAPQYLADPMQQQQLDLQKKQIDWQQQMEGAKFNMQKGMYDQFAPAALSAMNGNGGLVGGQPRPLPAINDSPIYNQQQIQEQMNAGFAANDARTATLMRQLGQSAAGRGFGGMSPAIEAQRTQLGIANNQANATLQRELPMQYAQANADQNFRVNNLQQQQWRDFEQQDIERRKAAQDYLTRLMAMFGG